MNPDYVRCPSTASTERPCRHGHLSAGLFRGGQPLHHEGPSRADACDDSCPPLPVRPCPGMTLGADGPFAGPPPQHCCPLLHSCDVPCYLHQVRALATPELQSDTDVYKHWQTGQGGSTQLCCPMLDCCDKLCCAIMRKRHQILPFLMPCKDVSGVSCTGLHHQWKGSMHCCNLGFLRAGSTVC
jgi:hypothetical protein